MIRKTIRYDKETGLFVYESVKEGKYFLSVEDYGERLELTKEQALRFKLNENN